MAVTHAEAFGLFDISNGKAPCHATNHCFIQALDADALARALGSCALAGAEPGHIAIDGETLEGSRRRDDKAIHVLSAFSASLGAVVGDLVVAPDQNEITATMVLLKGQPPDLARAESNNGGRSGRWRFRARTGQWKTGCTGSATCRWTRTVVACAPVPARWPAAQRQPRHHPPPRSPDPRSPRKRP